MSSLRWYRYAPDWLGDGGIRLAGPDVERVENPDSADCIVVAQPMFVLFRDRSKWDRLWSDLLILRDPRRVVIADCSDDQAIPLVPGCIYWRGGLTAPQLRAYPTAVSAPWPSPDLSVWEKSDSLSGEIGLAFQGCAEATRWSEGCNCEHEPIPFQWDVSFVGWRTPLDVTVRSIASCEEAGLKCYFKVYDDFHGHRDPRAGCHVPEKPPEDAETARREEEYREALFGSRLVLCPESIRGVLRYRVTEAMSAARIPVIVGDEYVLPFAQDRIGRSKVVLRGIPWDEISVRIHHGNADRVGEVLADWLHGRSDEEILARGRLGQALYRRWLHKDRHPEILADVVRERLGLLP